MQHEPRLQHLQHLFAMPVSTKIQNSVTSKQVRKK